MDKEDAGMNLEDNGDTENHEDEIESFTDNKDNEVEDSHLETEVEEKTLEELKEENKTISDKMMRALAETENIRKKFFKEKKDAEIYGGTKLAKDLLSVLDNLNRALESVDDEMVEKQSAVLEGIELTKKGTAKHFFKP